MRSSLPTVLVAFAAFVLVGSANGIASADCDAEWEQFLIGFPSKKDLPWRKQIFCDTLEKIDKHNNYETHSFRLGINELADLATEEFGFMQGGKALNFSDTLVYSPPVDYHPAATVDWRSRMGPIKNQGQCGSCWAFGAVDVIDFIAGSSHSEQQLVDCSGQGCKGGNPVHALNYLTGPGSDSEQAYPYKAKDGSCQRMNPTARVSNVRSINSENALASVVLSQAAAGCIQGGDAKALQQYRSGVFDESCGNPKYGHCIGVVGYTGDYWIIRNSWGPSWGMSGYGYFKRGVDLCNIGTRGGAVASVSVVTSTGIVI